MLYFNLSVRLLQWGICDKRYRLSHHFFSFFNVFYKQSCASKLATSLPEDSGSFHIKL